MAILSIKTTPKPRMETQWSRFFGTDMEDDDSEYYWNHYSQRYTKVHPGEKMLEYFGDLRILPRETIRRMTREDERKKRLWEERKSILGLDLFSMTRKEIYELRMAFEYQDMKEGDV